MKNTQEEKAVVLGKAKFGDFEAFVEWTKTEEADEFFSTPNLWTKYLYNLQGEIPGVNVSHLFDMTSKKTTFGKVYDEKDKYYIEPLKKCLEYIQFFSSDETSLSFDLLYEHEKFDIIAFGNKQFLIPAGNLTKTLWADYSSLSPSQILSLHNPEKKTEESGLITMTALSNVSEKEMKEEMKKGEEEKAKVLAAIDDIENARTGELAALQKEIEEKQRELEEKKASMMESLNKKKAEMERILDEMNKKLFMLETEIYSIRCFLGETVDFIKLKAGKEAPIETPVVLYQKVRYLDEELGKMVSLYDFDFSDVKLFEKFLVHHPMALDVFCDADKCVSLVRVSKTGKAFSVINTPYGDILDTYKVFHGEKIGIIIRNGENLYLGWTDDEKITISEDMFFTPGESEVVESEEKDRYLSEREKQAKVNSQRKEMVSRYFIFSILQGVLENRKLLTLPKKVSFAVPSEYIIYSAADAWLSDNRYGTFADIVEKCNSYVAKGHDIIILESISDGHYSQSWGGHTRYFDRDRNDSRRTGDVRAQDGKLYKVNLVEKDSYDDECIFISLIKDTGDYVYRSGEFYERQRDAHANFKVYKEEFVNLTFMNSVWLKYVITNRNLGKSESRKEGNFAHMILYLNKALEFVKEREKKEEALISSFYPSLSSISDWPVLLSEWKLENKVKEITEYQAKRFAKTLE